jgi:hypothetical protein
MDPATPPTPGRDKPTVPALTPARRRTLHDFNLAVNRAPELLEELQDSHPYPMATRANVPAEAGFYLLSQESKPLYVGQSRNLRRRLFQHQRRGGRHNEATYAFTLTVREAHARGLTVQGLGRAELEANAEFALLFANARDRVREMDARVILNRGPDHAYLV